MQAKMKFVAVALAGTLAVASAMAQMTPAAGSGYGRMDGRGPPSAEQITQRLTPLKDALKLRPDQISAWDAYEAKLVAAAQARSKMHEAMPARGDRDAMADFHVTMMKFNAQAAEETNLALKALVARLSAEQKATFDVFRPGPGPMAGGRGDGPGHRHGHRPRGNCVDVPAKT